MVRKTANRTVRWRSRQIGQLNLFLFRGFVNRESLMETEATPALPIRGGGGHSRRGHVNLTNDIRGFGSREKDGRIDSTKRITDGHKRCAGDGARNRRRSLDIGGQVWDRSYGAIDIQGDSGDSFPC